MRLLVIQHDLDKGLGLLEPGLRAGGLTLDVRRAGVDDLALDGHAGVVALPGLADPPDATAAVAETRAVLADALAAGLPALGLCLGAELLAEAAGGSTHPCRPEWGLAEVRLLPDASGDALLGSWPAAFPAFHAHAYAVEPPPGAAVLAESDVCPQAFRVGAQAWGVQFHPEASVSLVATVLPTVARQLEAAGVDAAATVARIRELEPEATVRADALATGFARTVHAAGAVSRA